MQFTYEREGNLCWIADYLTFPQKDNVIHYKEYTGTHEGVETGNTKVSNLIDYLENEDLTLDNFPGLEDYLKENYPEVLPSKQSIPNYKKLLIDCVLT